MPFKSQAQAKYMFANHPGIAKEFAAATPSIKSLPQKLNSAKQAAKNLRKKKNG